MNSTDLVLRLIDALDHAGVSYMLVGSHSSSYYRRPRSMHNARLLVQINNEQLSRVTSELGEDLRVDRQMSFEMITFTSRCIIHHPSSAFKIDLFLLSDDPHDQQRFGRRQDVGFEGRRAWLLSAEDVVITKSRWSRGGRCAKDVEDVGKILAVRGASLDHAYIRQWTDRHETRELFDRMLAQAGERTSPS